MISLFTILVDRIIASVFTTMGLRQDENKMIIIFGIQIYVLIHIRIAKVSVNIY